MKSLNVSIELRDAAGSDYEILQAALEARGFARADTKNTTEPAAYTYAGELSPEAVMELAWQAADETKKRFVIFIDEPRGQRWSGMAG